MVEGCAEETLDGIGGVVGWGGGGGGGCGSGADEPCGEDVAGSGAVGVGEGGEGGSVEDASEELADGSG